MIISHTVAVSDVCVSATTGLLSATIGSIPNMYIAWTCILPGHVEFL